MQAILLEMIGLIRDYRRIAAEQDRRLTEELEASAACIDALERFCHAHNITGGHRQ